MVARLAKLTLEQKYELLHLLSPGRARPGLSENAVSQALVTTLRRSLALSDRIDLPQGFRRRLIEVAAELGVPGDPSGYDLASDEEIARTLVERVFQHANELTRTAERATTKSSSARAAAEDFRAFADSFRTMPQDERERWLTEAAKAAATARTNAGSEEPARIADSIRSHEETARRLAADVAAAGATGSVARAAAGSAAVGSGLTSLAGPVGVVAGSAFLYTLRKRRRTAQAGKADKRGDSTKERLSPMVRAVVTTCVYLLGHPGKHGDG